MVMLTDNEDDSNIMRILLVMFMIILIISVDV